MFLPILAITLCINNSKINVAGRISMDWTMFDVTDVPNIKVGDEVILIGEKNDLKITAEQIAEKIQTISYEITCGISRRVTRVYI